MGWDLCAIKPEHWSHETSRPIKNYDFKDPWYLKGDESVHQIWKTWRDCKYGDFGGKELPYNLYMFYSHIDDHVSARQVAKQLIDFDPNEFGSFAKWLNFGADRDAHF